MPFYAYYHAKKSSKVDPLVFLDLFHPKFFILSCSKMLHLSEAKISIWNFEGFYKYMKSKNSVFYIVIKTIQIFALEQNKLKKSPTRRKNIFILRRWFIQVMKGN